MAMSFADLVADVRACTICTEHLPLGPRPVLQIDPAARLLIVGQAPGRKVHEFGVAFDDPSGTRLRDWLGLTPAEFYDPTLVAILPMGFCYPGTGRSGDLPPRPECAPAWRERLLAGLTNVQLTVVIGQYAQAWHLPNAPKSVTDTVAAWEQFWPAVVPLPHPSPRNNIWLRRNPWFTSDLLPRLRDRVARITAS
jgi:uracil-DNA glycosylase